MGQRRFSWRGAGGAGGGGDADPFPVNTDLGGIRMYISDGPPVAIMSNDQTSYLLASDTNANVVASDGTAQVSGGAAAIQCKAAGDIIDVAAAQVNLPENTYVGETLITDLGGGGGAAASLGSLLIDNPKAHGMIAANGTTITVSGMPSLNTFGSNLFASRDASGPFSGLSTAATAASKGGITSSISGFIQVRWGPRWLFKFAVPDLTTMEAMVGWIDDNASSGNVLNFSGMPTNAHCILHFDPGQSANWRWRTRKASGQGQVNTNTGVAPVASAVYHVLVDAGSGTGITMKLMDSALAVLHTHTVAAGDLPAGDQNFRPVVGVTTFAAASRTVQFYWAHMVRELT